MTSTEGEDSSTRIHFGCLQRSKTNRHNRCHSADNEHDEQAKLVRLIYLLLQEITVKPSRNHGLKEYSRNQGTISKSELLTDKQSSQCPKK